MRLQEKLTIIGNKATFVGDNMAKQENRQAANVSTRTRATTTNPTKASDDLKQLHVDIPGALHKKFKMKALEEGRSMNQVVEDLIAEYLSR